jgi:transcriptional regulator with XRE-family HTH domain
VDTDAGHGNGTGAPVRKITVNQAVAWNIAWLRRAAGLKQDQLGGRIGWTSSQVSEAERSFDGKRVREFDAQDLAVLAVGLGVPIAALLMPPGEDGAEEGYAFRDGAGNVRGMRDLLGLTIPDNDEETPVMVAYRERWAAMARRHLAGDPYWLRLAARWVGNIPGRRAEIAARLRAHRDALLRASAEYGEFAEEIERDAR